MSYELQEPPYLKQVMDAIKKSYPVSQHGLQKTDPKNEEEDMDDNPLPNIVRDKKVFKVDDDSDEEQKQPPKKQPKAVKPKKTKHVDDDEEQDMRD